MPKISLRDQIIGKCHSFGIPIPEGALDAWLDWFERLYKAHGADIHAVSEYSYREMVYCINQVVYDRARADRDRSVPCE